MEATEARASDGPVCTFCRGTLPIQVIVARAFHIDPVELKGSRRTQPLSTCRQVAMFLCRRWTGLSFPEIGRAFGGRSHATVIWACRQVSRRIAVDPGFPRLLARLEQELRSATWT